MSESVDPRRLKITDEAGSEGTLIGFRCRECGVMVFGPATFCQSCTSFEVEPVDLGREGTLFSYTVVRIPPAGWPGEVPYILGQVELPSGPQVLAEVIDCDQSALAIGMPVELAIQAVPAQEGGEDKLVYKWRPTSQEPPHRSLLRCKERDFPRPFSHDPFPTTLFHDPFQRKRKLFAEVDAVAQLRSGREVVVAGVGLHPFGRFRDKDLSDLALEAVVESLKDAGVRWRDIPIAYFGHVYYHGMSLGETTLSKLGLTGVPIVNVENACSSGSTAFWQAYWGITTGIYDMALAFGAEKVPRGPVTVTPEDAPERYIGGDHMMAGYALRARRYMEETGAPATALAQVSVKARQNATLNPYAHRKDTYSLEEVLQSRLIADPLTLFQCCPTSEGAAAAVLCARESLAQYGIDESRAVSIAAAVLTSGEYNGRGADHSAFSPYRTEPAALQAYEMSGLGPEDVDLCQVHDAATIGELQQIESLHLAPFGEAWQATVEGRTALNGDIPTNTDGGLLAMGHPFGASGIRMIHETVTQLRGEAGPRQVARARVGVAQCSGAGDVTTVHILKK